MTFHTKNWSQRLQYKYFQLYMIQSPPTNIDFTTWVFPDSICRWGSGSMALELQCQVHCQLLSTGQTYCKGTHDQIFMLQLPMHSIRLLRQLFFNFCRRRLWLPSLEPARTAIYRLSGKAFVSRLKSESRLLYLLGRDNFVVSNFNYSSKSYENRLRVSKDRINGRTKH